MHRTDPRFGIERLLVQRVGSHHVDRRALQQTLSIQLAAVEHHLREAQIVGRRRIQTAAARRQARHFADQRIPWQRGERALGLVPCVDRRDPRQLRFWYEEAGVLHPERREDPVAQEVRKRFPRQLLDQIALNVDGHAVDPLLARLI